jgi:hypothetical protein
MFYNLHNYQFEANIGFVLLGRMTVLKTLRRNQELLLQFYKAYSHLVIEGSKLFENFAKNKNPLDLKSRGFSFGVEIIYKV